MPILLGILGERLAGKDTAGDYLVTQYQAFQIKYSTILDEVLDILDLPKSRRNEIDLGMAMRNAFHEGVLWGAVKKKIAGAPHNIKVINGIRFQDEFDNAKALGAKMIYVTAPQELLYQRFLERKQKADDSTLTAQEFAKLEQEPTEVKISYLGSKCDFKIENVGSQEELYGKIDGIMEGLE